MKEYSTPAHSGPLSPAEWLAEKYGPHLPDLPIGKVMKEMEAYAAHVAAYTQAAALQSAIDEINRTAFPGECLDRLFPVIEKIKDIPR